jgi:pimeloyl-ACP methyl ester carboxylesterase
VPTFLSHDNTSIHYAKGGRGKRWLIAIHGAGSNHTTWLNSLNGLSGVRWLAFDTRAHGKSNGLPDVQKSAADIIALADKEGIRHFSVAGICYGGTMALEAARRYPDRVDNVVVVSPFDRGLVAGTGIVRAVCKVVGGVFGNIPTRKRLAYVDYCEKPSVPYLLTWFEDLQGIHTKHYATAAIQSIDFPTDFRITQPLLVISGRKDYFLRHKELHKRLLVHGHYRWVEVPCNHHILTWQSERAARLINAFLESR